MSDDKPKDDMARRAALKVIARSAGAAVGFPVLNRARPFVGAQGVAPLPTQASKFFNDRQIQTLAALSEAIMPADEHSPGAKAARVYDYIDTILGKSGQKAKDFWTQGLAAIDKATELEHGVKFTECTTTQQAALLEKISKNENHPTTLEERFFVAVKRATIDGYYTSEVGIHKELEYQGNTALVDFPGCVHEGHKADKLEEGKV